MTAPYLLATYCVNSLIYIHRVLDLICLIVYCCIYVQFCSLVVTMCLHTVNDPLYLGFNENVPDNCDYLDYSDFKTKDQTRMGSLLCN